jgi:hypothetical protein
MRSLPAQSQSSKAWLYVDGLLLETATSGGPIDETIDYLKRALKADGLL